MALQNEKTSRYLLRDWKPENPAFWENKGKHIARRNLWISVSCLLLAFCVWMLFSAVTVNLNKIGFNFTTDQLFLLTALPSVSGALLRVPYSFMVPIFGGRRWTVFSTAILIIPCVWLGIAVQNPNTPFGIFIVIALLCGFAGANFASSMGNISFFFPKAKQGSALGINGGKLRCKCDAAGCTAGHFCTRICLSRRQWRTAGRRFGDVAGECRMDLGAITGDCHDRRLVRDE